MKKLFFLCMVFFLSLCGVCVAEPLPVFVSILPQKYFLEKIGGDLVSVSVMVPPGANPVTYEPKPTQMAALSEAKAYFAVDVPFERVWLPRFEQINKNMLLVRTDAGIEKRQMAAANPLHVEGERPDKVRSHDHGSLDPHVWLSPPLVMLQARNVLDGLIKTDPGHRKRYESNYRGFIEEAVKLDLEILDLFTPREGPMRFMVFHPSWGYFAAAYGLDQTPIEVEGKEPKPAELAELITIARKEKIKALFVQPQFSVRSAETIAREIGAKVFYADPLAEDWANNLKRMALELRQALMK